MGSSTSMSFGSCTYALAISARCLSPEEQSDSGRLRMWSRPNVLSASRVMRSSSGVSHHRRSTNGYLPSTTMSITVMLNVAPISAGTEATSLAISTGLRRDMSIPSTVTMPDVGS